MSYHDTPPCGIFTLSNLFIEATREYPLVNATCACKVLDVYTLTELVQEYASNATVDQQVQYAFPLPPSAAVCSFKAVIDNNTINGVIKAKEEAKRMYNDAIARGKKAGLLEKQHVDSM